MLGAGGDQDRGEDALRIARRPFERQHAAHRAADDAEQAVDAEMVEQHGLGAHHVGDGDDRKVDAPGRAGGRIGRGRPGRAHAAADHVRADDEETVGVDRLARSDHGVPPAGPSGDRMDGRDMLVAGQRMADEDGVGLVVVERADRRCRRRAAGASAMPLSSSSGRSGPKSTTRLSSGSSACLRAISGKLARSCSPSDISARPFPHQPAFGNPNVSFGAENRRAILRMQRFRARRGAARRPLPRRCGQAGIRVRCGLAPARSRAHCPPHNRRAAMFPLGANIVVIVAGGPGGPDAVRGGEDRAAGLQLHGRALPPLHRHDLARPQPDRARSSTRSAPR